jgi:hypothetical protein
MIAISPPGSDESSGLSMNCQSGEILPDASLIHLAELNEAEFIPSD